ncbi:ATPase family associated with various cellular activities (AAA) [Frankineae bacterium MT45]|nr:ATPase family associated with various cellular activities (AAA) [Frankineae bacterium MT45]
MMNASSGTAASSEPAAAFSTSEARAFARTFQAFLEWVASEQGDERNPVTALLHEWLGERAAESVVTRSYSPFEHVNVQTALNAWSTMPERSVRVEGVATPPHYGGLSLQQLMVGDGPPLRLTSPELIDLPDGPDSTLACLRSALMLVDSTDAGRYVVFVRGPSEHQPDLALEIVGLPVSHAQQILAELDHLRSRLNVYRGHLLDVQAGPTGMQLSFVSLPPVHRGDVILPEATLRRIERHAIGMAEHRDSLLAAGQHLKRGVLLYGPPGTGKTHTTRYIVSQMDGYTRFLMSGQALAAIGGVSTLARELEPSVLVMEDVDLVATDRSFTPNGNPVLFELLDAMDGAAADADLLFLLTTNRADLLEAALAARPGRVDVAVEIERPDADARRRLIELYAQHIPLAISEDEIDSAVTRTEGVTASFVKELLRRAVLNGLQDGADQVAGTHLEAAVEDLLDSSQRITRRLLGADADDLEPADPSLLQPATHAFVTGRGRRGTRFYYG